MQGRRLTATTIGNVGQADPIEVVLFEQFALFGGQLGDTRGEGLTAGIGLVLKPILGVRSQLEEKLVVENELTATRRITAMGKCFEIGDAEGPGFEVRADGVFVALVPDEKVGLLHNVCHGTCVPHPDQRSDVGVQRWLNKLQFTLSLRFRESAGGSGRRIWAVFHGKHQYHRNSDRHSYIPKGARC